MEDTWIMNYHLKKLAIPYLKNTLKWIAKKFKEEKMKKIETLEEEKKKEILINLCGELMRRMNKKLSKLPEIFFVILNIVKSHFVHLPRDAIISTFFLRLVYVALVTPENFFQEENLNKNDTKNFLAVEKKNSARLRYSNDSPLSPTRSPNRKNIRFINVSETPSYSSFLKLLKMVVCGIYGDYSSNLLLLSKMQDSYVAVLELIQNISDGEKYKKKFEKFKGLFFKFFF